MESLGRVQVQSVQNSQIWQAMPEEDYSAVVLAAASSAANTYFDVLRIKENQICLRSAVTKNGAATYVSARWGDWYGKLQLQEPHSAGWITAVGGDETFLLVNIGGGDVALKLANPSRFVSARIDTPDTRTHNNGITVSVNQGFTLFDSGYGAAVESLGGWEKFKLLGDSATIEALVSEVGVPL